MIAHLLALVKTVTKSYMSLIHWHYINNLSAMYIPNEAYISPYIGYWILRTTFPK